eukprot:TRINITY_DN1630_c0_g1_i2.p1 TRINITY_DN1630_c0_g1~~TRINITY_DN1630_c0_g1_i2.p1  ORF type:complete len:253 (-),score=25.22 TRINITY_DN1630_c0_g1_i2:52-810(-)
MGIGDEKWKVYIIDFGLSSYWRDENGHHIPYSKSASFHGTHRYASTGNHFKIQPSRRDDLEALGYVLIYFLNGSLPWQNVKVKRKKKRKIIGQIKRNTDLKDLTKHLPNQFREFIKYVRKLRFEEEPDYDKLRTFFRECFNQKSYTLNYKYDWDDHQNHKTKRYKKDGYHYKDPVTNEKDNKETRTQQSEKKQTDISSYKNDNGRRSRSDQEEISNDPVSRGSCKKRRRNTFHSPSFDKRPTKRRKRRLHRS